MLQSTFIAAISKVLYTFFLSLIKPGEGEKRQIKREYHLQPCGGSGSSQSRGGGPVANWTVRFAKWWPSSVLSHTKESNTSDWEHRMVHFVNWRSDLYVNCLLTWHTAAAPPLAALVVLVQCLRVPLGDNIVVTTSALPPTAISASYTVGEKNKILAPIQP